MLVNYFLIKNLKYFIQSHLQGSHSGAWGQNGSPEAILPFLTFWFFFVKKKERKKGQNARLNNFLVDKRSIAFLSKPVVAGFTFFLLEQKEPTNSRMPDRLRAAFSPARLGGYRPVENLSNFLRFGVPKWVVCHAEFILASHHQDRFRIGYFSNGMPNQVLHDYAKNT